MPREPKLLLLSDADLAKLLASLSEDNIDVADWRKIDAIKAEQRRRLENEIEG